MPFIGEENRKKTSTSSSTSSVPSSTAASSSRVYTIKGTDGVTFKLNQSQVDWIKTRYKKSADNAYKDTAEDIVRRSTGALPSAYESGYTNTNVDRGLYQNGLPSSKYLAGYINDYMDWYGDGTTYSFDDDAKSYISDAYKKTWTYEYTAEDQARKVAGTMPISVENSYADNYTDYQLMQQGLPPTSKLSDYTDAWDTRVNQQNRVNEFYAAVSAKAYTNLALGGVKNDATMYDSPVVESASGVGIGVDPNAKKSDEQTPISQTSGSTKWEDAFYDMLEQPEWADVAALYKKKSTTQDIEENKYADNLSYREAKIKAINAENEDAGSDSETPYVSYDDFLKAYTGTYEKQYRATKIVDDALQTANGGNYTYGDLEKDLAAEKQSATYSAIVDRKTARAYAESTYSSGQSSDPSSILQGMYDGGVDIKHVRQAKNALHSLMKKNGATEDEIDALENTYSELESDANPKTDLDIAKEKYGILSKEYAAVAKAETKKQYEEAYQSVEETKATRTQRSASKQYATDLYDGYRSNAFSTVSKDEATKTFQSYIKYDGKNVDQDSLDAAKVALADMGLTNYEISEVEKSVESGSESTLGKKLLALFFPDSAIDQTEPNYFNQGQDWDSTQQLRSYESDAGITQDLTELFAAGRNRAVSEGVMNAYEFDQGVREAGYSRFLDPAESAKTYYIEVEAPASGVTEETASKEWDSWTPELQQRYIDWFNGSYMTNPEVAKSTDEVIAYQGIAAIGAKMAANTVGSVVGLADGFESLFSGRSDTWDFTKQVQEFTSYINNYGRSNQSFLTQGVSAASDIGAQVAQMYLMNALGAPIGEATELSSTIASSATSNGVKFLAKAGLFTAQSTPFLLNSMGSYYNEATQGGASIDQARWYALVMGGLEGFTESWQTDALWGKVLGKNMSASIANGAGKTFSSSMLTKAKFINLAASFLGEATEEAAGYAGSWLMSSKQGWNEDAFSLKEMGNQALMGGLVGILGSALSLPAMNEANIVAEYMSKNEDYGATNYDLLLSETFANALSDETKAQYIAQGYKAIMPTSEYRSSVENVTQSVEQLKSGEVQYKKNIDEMQKSYEKKLRNSTNAELALDYLRQDGVDPASDEFMQARANLIKFGRVSEAQAKHSAELQQTEDAYKSVKQQQTRAIEKSLDKIKAHHAVLADLFSDDISYMEQSMATDTADGINFAQYKAAADALAAFNANGDNSSDSYKTAVEALGQAQTVRDQIYGFRDTNKNRGVATAEKMRAARAGNIKEYMEAQTQKNTGTRSADRSASTSTQGTERIISAASMAQSAQQKLDSIMDQVIASSDGAVVGKTGVAKSMSSIQSKVGRNKTDPLSLNDLSRGCLFVSSYDGISDTIQKTIDTLKENGAEIVSVKDFFANPNRWGYRGFHVNAQIDGVGTEIQFATEDVWNNVKEKSEVIYAKWRDQESDLSSLLPEKINEYYSDRESAKKLWDDAAKAYGFPDAVSLANSDSVTIRPLQSSSAVTGLDGEAQVPSRNSDTPSREILTSRPSSSNETSGTNLRSTETPPSYSESISQGENVTQDGVGNITAGAMLGKKQLSEGRTNISQFYTNTLERMDSDSHTQEARNAMQAFDEAYTYDVVSEKESVAKAQERLARGITPELLSDLKTKNTWTGVDVDVAMAIKEAYKQAGIETGNMDDYANWTMLIADRVGEGGRALQALAKYTRDADELAIAQMQRNVKKSEQSANKKTKEKVATQTNDVTKTIDDAIENGSSADDVEQAAQNTVKKKTAKSIRDAFVQLQNGEIDRAAFNKKLSDAVKTENGLSVITSDDAARVIELLDTADQQTDDYQRRRYQSMAAKIVANTEGVSLGEKLRSFQRVMMLLNPRTILRNIDANIVLTPVEWLKDVPATVADMIASQATGERTTTVNLQKQAAWFSGLKRGATESIQDMKYGVNTGKASGKYEMANKDIWKNRFMQTLDSFVGYGLNAGDRPFYEAAYDEFMTNERLLGHDTESEDVQKRVVGLSLDRVFQGNPKLYDVVKGMRDTLDKSGLPIGTLLLPFTKTPANLADKILDYSPAGLVKASVQLGISSKTGEFDQKLFVDRVGRSVTGTGLMILGYTLAKAGLVHGSGDDDKERQAMKNAGIAQYSLQLGDTSISINWAEPVGSIVLMGAELAKSGANSDSLNVLQGIYTGGKMLINSFFNNTVLSNVVSLFSSGYGDVAGGFENFALGTTTQFVPSMLSAIARATDPVERDTYDPNSLLQQGKKILSYFPGLRQTLPFKYGTDGQIVESNYGDTFFSRVFNSMLNPSLVDTKSDDKVNSEIYRLYQAGFTDQLLPSAAKTLGGVKLSASQHREYQQALGEACYNAAEGVINSSWYRSMSDAEKSDALYDAISGAADDARAAFKAGMK